MLLVSALGNVHTLILENCYYITDVSALESKDAFQYIIHQNTLQNGLTVSGGNGLLVNSNVIIIVVVVVFRWRRWRRPCSPHDGTDEAASGYTQSQIL